MEDYHFTYPDGSPGTIDGSLSREEALAQKANLVAQWKKGQGSTASDALGPALEGLTGGFLDEASGALGALIGAMRGDQTAAEGYRQGYEGSKGRRERFAAAQPGWSTALEVGGSIAGFGLAPEIKAAEALGVGGRLAGRVVNAGATGAGYGALAGAGYAESPGGLDSTPGEIAGSTLAGAAGGATVGGLAGAGGEAAIAGIGQGIRRGVGAVRRGALGDVTRGDVEAQIGRNIRRESGMTPDELVARMQELQGAGYPAVVGDLGGVRTRRMARAAADISPEAQATLEGVTGPRRLAQTTRTEAAIERASGGVGRETRYGLQDRVDQAMRERGQLYDQAYVAGDRGISWSPQMAHLAQNEPIFQRAMREGRDALRANNNAARAVGGQEWDLAGLMPGPDGGLPGRGGSGPRATLAYWDQVKRALDRMERVARGPEGGHMTENARAIDLMRRHLVGHLTNEVPEYQRALGTYSQLFGGRDAGEAGVEAFNTHMPGIELQRVMADMTPAEIDMFRASWISRFAQDIADVRDVRDITQKIGASNNAREQLTAMFGPEGTRQLLHHRNTEQMLGWLHNEVTGNSKTARYAIGILGGAGLGAVGSGGNILDPHTWLGAAAGAAAGMGVVRARGMLAGAINERAARWIAEALTSQDPALLRRVATAARQRPEIRAAVSRLGKMFAGGTVGATQQ